MGQENKPFMEQLTEAHDEVIAAILKPIKEAWREVKEDSVFERLLAFVHAIDWKEPWLMGLLAAQALLWLSVVAMRRNTAYLSIVFCFGASAIYFGERLNALLASRWRSFATQPYFDPNGAFFSAVVSAPLVITLFTVLIMYLLQVVAMMVDVKKLQLRAQRRRQQQQGQEAAGGGGGGGAAGESKKGR